MRVGCLLFSILIFMRVSNSAAADPTSAVNAATSAALAAVAVSPVASLNPPPDKPPAVVPPVQCPLKEADSLSSSANTFEVIATALHDKIAKAASERFSSQPMADFRIWGWRCGAYIGLVGDFGPLGKTIKTTLEQDTALPVERQSYRHLHDSDASATVKEGQQKDWAQLCPNYPRMNESEKQNMWIWFAASVAMAESSCDSRIAVGAMRGQKAGGLYQFPNQGGAVCRREAVHDPAKSTLCFLRELNTEFGDRNTVLDYNRDSRTTYWQVLHAGSQSQKFRNLLHQYKDCRD